MPEIANSRRPEAVVIIRNIKGLHARASAKFVKCAERFNAEVTVTRDGQSVGGTSIMGLMMLAAGPGSQLHITAQGPQGPLMKIASATPEPAAVECGLPANVKTGQGRPG